MSHFILKVPMQHRTKVRSILRVVFKAVSWYGATSSRKKMTTLDNRNSDELDFEVDVDL